LEKIALISENNRKFEVPFPGEKHRINCMDVIRFLQRNPAPRILVIRQKPLGDTVLTLPVFHALKQHFPQSKLTIIVSRRFSDIVSNHPHIDEILEYDRGSYLRFLIFMLFRKFDISIDFINNPRSAQISLFAGARFRMGLPRGRNFFYNLKKNTIQDKDYVVEKNLGVLRTLGIIDPPIHYLYKPGPEAMDFARHSLGRDQKEERLYVGLYVSGSAPTQKWPLSRFLTLGKMLAEKRGVEVMILWGPEDRDVIVELSKDPEYSEKFVFVPPTRADQLGAFIQHCRIFVTGDGGPKHMAVALNIPTLTIYGGIEARYWNPPDYIKFPIRKSDIQCYPCNDKKSCRYGTYECLESIAIDDVYGEVARLLKDFARL
jgi:ADP-heptose:LPS heptosyltransferase